MKTKEIVRLRSRAIANGNKSLYLDYYHDGVREYEYLKLYLVPERTASDRARNKDTMMMANAIKAKRVIEINENRYGMRHKSDASLTAYIEGRMEGMGVSTFNSWHRMIDLLMEHTGGRDVRMSELSHEFCDSFRSMVYKSVRSGNTARLYFSKFRCAILGAYKDGLLSEDYCKNIKVGANVQSERKFLTVEELRAFSAVETSYRETKRAFVFCCLTGLRYSDARKLEWRDISEVDGYTRITFKQQKTKRTEYMDLNPQAVELLGERGEGNVFSLTKNSNENDHIAKIAAKAGIRKHVTFHSSRHTFAVTLLSVGVDIYTVSKLLGHADIKTTQVYAKILDEGKREAVNRLPSVL